jgi:flagellar assembly protein FliH
MSAPAKYLFDHDFAAGAKTANSVSLVEHRTKLVEAENRGYCNGFAAAQAEEAAQSARRLAAALESAANAFGEIARGLSGVEQRLETEAVEVAVAAARKLAPALIAREPFSEIAALVAECLRQLTAPPHVVVRLNEAIYGQARERLEELARQTGFEGRLVVLAEPEFVEGDCRIEWADGGVNRDRAAADAVIGETVARYLAGRPAAQQIEG